MAGLKVIGIWLEDCGWVETLVQAKVAYVRTGNSVMKVSHVTTRRSVEHGTRVLMALG